MAKHIIPFGDRILVKREVVGKTLGSAGIIVASEDTADTKTDIATVVYIPEHSFADKKLIENAEKIVESHTNKAEHGDSDALVALLRYNQYLKIKSIKPGDKVFISKYVGTDFHDNAGNGNLTIVLGDDIIGLVQED